MKWKHLSLYYPLFLFTFFIFSFFLLPTRVNAESLTGAWTMYVQNSNGNNLPQNYSSTIPGITFPSSSYTQLSGSTVNLNPNIFTVVTRVDLQPTYTYVKGNYYTITVNFETGSYIIPYFPTNSSNWFVSQCTNSLCNTTPSVTYNFIIDSTHQGTNTLQVVIKFTATANTSNSTILLGNLTDAKGNFYNQYSGQQGLRISSATIDYVDNSVDFTPVIESNEQNTQNIINNNNQNTQTIINNQNSNTDKEIESQKVCNSIDLDFTRSNTESFTCGYLGSTGAVIGNDCNSYRISNFISINKDNTYKLSVPYSNQYLYYCLYDTSKEVISCNNYLDTRNITKTFVPSSDGYVRFSIPVAANSYITNFSGESCKNGNQALNDTLTDSNLPDVINSGGGGGTYFDDINQSSDTPISDLILLPLNILNSLQENLSSSCQPYTLPFDFSGGNNSLTFPCLNLQNYLGTDLWGIIDGMFCIIMFYNIAMLIIKFYENWSSLRDTFDILYESKGGIL